MHECVHGAATRPKKASPPQDVGSHTHTHTDPAAKCKCATNVDSQVNANKGEQATIIDLCFTYDDDATHKHTHTHSTFAQHRHILVVACMCSCANMRTHTSPAHLCSPIHSHCVLARHNRRKSQVESVCVFLLFHQQTSTAAAAPVALLRSRSELNRLSTRRSPCRWKTCANVAFSPSVCLKHTRLCSVRVDKLACRRSFCASACANSRRCRRCRRSSQVASYDRTETSVGFATRRGTVCASLS